MKLGEIRNQSGFLSNNTVMKYNKKDSIKEGLQNQIINIQKQIYSVSENKSLSIEQKKQMQKDLKEQLNELNKQIIQRDLEIRKEQEEKREENIKEQLKDKNYIDDEQQEMTNLFSITSSLNQVKFQTSASVKIKGNARVLESEIKADEGRGLDVSEKRKKLSEMKDKIRGINKKIIKTMNEVNKEIKKSSKKEPLKNVEQSSNENEEKRGNNEIQYESRDN
ncbi:FlxA-like protein [Acetoanaerobium noterae]|uniref:FlxA-like protein n=1 Tax=Acetoanaerobium noterae TaxID=745369 RepID=A0A1T5AIN1_9FIRM|nr:FlxA-like family protein [Acetoanaerobium noterae]SKB34816.1 FlxA-like protein [Acetoanaerobium noterae]